MLLVSDTCNNIEHDHSCFLIVLADDVPQLELVMLQASRQANHINLCCLCMVCRSAVSGVVDCVVAEQSVMRCARKHRLATYVVCPGLVRLPLHSLSA
jgi:hypothetical protein